MSVHVFEINFAMRIKYKFYVLRMCYDFNKGKSDDIGTFNFNSA